MTTEEPKAGGVTWNQIAAHYPDFVQWIVARHGPLPDGRVSQVDYELWTQEYRHEQEKERG